MNKSKSPKSSPSDVERKFRDKLSKSNRTRKAAGKAFEEKLAEIKKQYSSMID